ncbi:chromosome segregation SMC family protein, partial [Rhodothermus marinus]|uniref:chromosome segregation SMC family protein n=1 Tax=Rhodothermus marinus TaxID=29549 RepID=UPI001FB4B10D
MGGLKVGTAMYLSKLELQGFKSFADRTVLHFDPGITAIVGPNGCGKSNLVDAVRWVIGEQRARVLRSERMEHVIFNGTARRRPVGMAEVLLTIENTRGILPLHYSEVTIGRRLYRSGESEYLLNGTSCRLRDIQELFMDTGMGAGAYSVIELKMIEDILSDNAQDRRHLFEEAAGITRYKLRRTQTLRKLDATRGDLTRLRDLIEEVRRQVDTLKRQADRAERYRRYRDELRTLEQALLRHDYDRLREQADALEALLDEVQMRLREARTRYEALRRNRPNCSSSSPGPKRRWRPRRNASTRCKIACRRSKVKAACWTSACGPPEVNRNGCNAKRKRLHVRSSACSRRWKPPRRPSGKPCPGTK